MNDDTNSSGDGNSSNRPDNKQKPPPILDFAGVGDAWFYGAAFGVGVSLIGGILYLAKNLPKNQGDKGGASRNSLISPQPASDYNRPSTSVGSYLSDMFNKISNRDEASTSGVTVKEIYEKDPPNMSVTNLNSLLADIHNRYIRLQEFGLHYRVFDTIFQDLHQKMKEVDPYYKKYSSSVQFAGSHYDHLRIKKPDEFDMDIVIDLPLDMRENSLDSTKSDIIIEPKFPGYLQLRTGVQFERLPMRDGNEWQINKTAFKWKDDSNYLLNTNFLNWFKSVVNKALNKYPRNSGNNSLCYVDSIEYIVEPSEQGPAMTLRIHNKSRNFKLDVDLVPALKFPEERWPIGKLYRHIPPRCFKGYWMVVGKPNKNTKVEQDKIRSWRIALQNQERQLIHNTFNLRQTIRLMKKLRDAQEMKEISSYFIKTLFFWEIIETNEHFWQTNNPATLFKLMVRRLHQALVSRRISYFWNKHFNLIEGVERHILDAYILKLVPLIDILDQPTEYKSVAQFLLTPDEFDEYRRVVNIW